MRMTHWTDNVYYSVIHDEIMARVSGFDEHCKEHFMIIKGGKGYRDRRTQALMKIQDSIENDGAPGEIKDDIPDVTH